jgi:hypothetical protein
MGASLLAPGATQAGPIALVDDLLSMCRHQRQAEATLMTALL